MKMKHMRTLSLCVTFLVLTLMIGQCESVLTLTSNKGESWKTGDYVTLTCKMTSYTNTLTWKYGSEDAAKCLTLSCQQLLTGDGSFIFSFDLTNAVFYWSLNPVRAEHQNKAFHCFDGTDTKTITPTVEIVKDETKQRAIDGIIIGSVALVLVLEDATSSSQKRHHVVIVMVIFLCIKVMNN